MPSVSPGMTASETPSTAHRDGPAEQAAADLIDANEIVDFDERRSLQAFHDHWSTGSSTALATAPGEAGEPTGAIGRASSAGRSLRQASTARKQRGEKEQPSRQMLPGWERCREWGSAGGADRRSAEWRRTDPRV